MALAHTEKLAALQFASIQNYTKTGLEFWKASLNVKDSDSFKEFTGQQQELAKELAEKVAQDAKEIMELGNGYTTQARKIIEDNVAEVNKTSA